MPSSPPGGVLATPLGTGKRMRYGVRALLMLRYPESLLKHIYEWLLCEARNDVTLSDALKSYELVGCFGFLKHAVSL